MIFETAYVLIFLVAFGQSERFIRHTTDALINFEAEPHPHFKPCICQNGKCTVNSTTEREVCGELHYRLRKHLQPVEMFFRCQMKDKTCSVPNSQRLYFDLLVDQDDLNHQPFYLGRTNFPTLLTNLLSRPDILKYMYVDKPTVKITAEYGVSGSPVTFEGALNIEGDQAAEIAGCWGQECAGVVNKVCKDLGEQFRVNVPKLADVLLGCRVNQIYQFNGVYRINFALMVDAKKAVSNKIFIDENDAWTKFEAAVPKVKLPSVMKSINLAGVVLKDYCKYDAEVSSLVPYYADFAQPSLGLPIHLAMQARSELAEQIARGQKDHLCLAEINEVEMTNANQLTKYRIRIAFDKICLSQFKGINSCNQYIKVLDSEWQKGDRSRHFIHFPKFDFKSLSE